MGLLEELRKKFNDCLADSCHKESCTLNLEGIRPHQIVIFDNDRCVASDKSLCDYILFYKPQELIISAVELKSGKLDAHHAVKQIENGAKKAEEYSAGYVVNYFIPLLLRGKRTHTADIKKVNNTKIPFRGRSLRIEIKRCGDSFNQILKEILPET